MEKHNSLQWGERMHKGRARCFMGVSGCTCVRHLGRTHSRKSAAYTSRVLVVLIVLPLKYVAGKMRQLDWSVAWRPSVTSSA